LKLKHLDYITTKYLSDWDCMRARFYRLLRSQLTARKKENRESGSIEQDADIVAFLYRDDYYDKESENKNIIECMIAKQRDGATGTVELAFIKEYGRFVTLEARYEN
jgi:hypothetical protein